MNIYVYIYIYTHVYMDEFIFHFYEDLWPTYKVLPPCCLIPSRSARPSLFFIYYYTYIYTYIFLYMNIHTYVYIYLYIWTNSSTTSTRIYGPRTRCLYEKMPI